jgi:hypothetical protein
MTYDESKQKAFLIDFENMDRTPTSAENAARLQNNYNDEVDPDDETYVLDQTMYYLLSNLKDTVLNALDREDLQYFLPLPRHMKASPSRTRKISRTRSL